MSGDDGDRSLRGYRAATDALDERPSAATRAAILAAASREVRASPRDAREPIAAPRARTRRRWPYAAAAVVMLSTLAVMLATRTEREMPTFTAPTERVAESAATPPPSSTPPQSPAASAASQDVASSPALAPSKPKAAAKEPLARGPVPVASDEAKVAQPTVVPRAKEEVAAMRATPAPATLASPQVAAEAAPAAPGVAPLAKRQAAPSIESAERRRDDSTDAMSAARSIQRQAPAAAPAAGLGAATGNVREETDASTGLSASQWLEKIIKLRRAGRHDEAELELKHFRESYPQVTVPAEALAASGTR